MGIYLRVSLLVMCILTFAYVRRKIRKSQMQVEDSLFWIGFSSVLVVLSIVPDIAYWAADILQIQSPSNFVFLVVLFLLMMQIFLLSIKVSRLENRLKNLIQIYAIADKKNRGEEKRAYEESVIDSDNI